MLEVIKFVLNYRNFLRARNERMEADKLMKFLYVTYPHLSQPDQRKILESVE